VPRESYVEYRCIDPANPHEADEAWTTDREQAEAEVEAFHGLGAKGYRLDSRIVRAQEAE
jgi:hypothetical protein